MTTNENSRATLAVMMSYKPDAELSIRSTFVKYRKELREKLLAEILVNGANDEHPTTLVLEFSGSGDSGQADNSFEDLHTNAFFMYMLNTKVTGDWYNNEGGGGTITWDLHEDEITVESYYNVQEQHSYPTVTIDKNNLENTVDPEE